MKAIMQLATAVRRKERPSSRMGVPRSTARNSAPTAPKAEASVRVATPV
jgi:hypothetical protein